MNNFEFELGNDINLGKVSANDFKESIKVKMVDADKFDNIEILKCVGNGSGISDTIKF